MWASVVVEADPVSDCAGCVLDAVKALCVNTLLLQRMDHTLNHAVLLRAERRDKFLLQIIAANECCVFPAGKNQTVIAAKQELIADLSQRTEPADQSVLGRAGSVFHGLATCSTRMWPVILLMSWSCRKTRRLSENFSGGIPFAPQRVSVLRAGI